MIYPLIHLHLFHRQSATIAVLSRNTNLQQKELISGLGMIIIGNENYVTFDEVSEEFFDNETTKAFFIMLKKVEPILENKKSLKNSDYIFTTGTQEFQRTIHKRLLIIEAVFGEPLY